MNNKLKRKIKKTYRKIRKKLMHRNYKNRRKRLIKIKRTAIKKWQLPPINKVNWLTISKVKRTKIIKNKL